MNKSCTVISIISDVDLSEFSEEVYIGKMCVKCSKRRNILERAKSAANSLK